ncbi:MAG: S8 family serine peptidase [Candidatus Omnitrophota bacterium]
MEKNILKLKRVLSVIFVLALAFFGCVISGDYVGAADSDKPGIRSRLENEGLKDTGPKFMPGEVIVKLKEGATTSDIQELNNKYKITAQERVFKDIPNPQEDLKKLKDKLANLDTKHESWYWQADKDSKEYKDYLAKIEKEKEDLNKQIKAKEDLIAKLEERQKRAPEDAVAPKLDNILILKAEDKNMDVAQMVSDYSANPNVEYAEPNYIARTQVFPQTLPDDAYVNPSKDGVTWSKGTWAQSYEDMWGLKKIQADKAWGITRGEYVSGSNVGKSVVVAVIDSGVDYTHPDLTANMWINPGEIPGNRIDDDGNGYIDDVYGFDFHNSRDVDGDTYYDGPNDINDADPMDGHGHGTHVAGTIAAIGNNGIGVIGVAPRVKIMALKGLGDGLSDGGSYSSLANAVYYATDMCADVLNNSWGGEGNSKMIIDAFHYAYAYGCVVVAAAGNDNMNAQDFEPANIDTAITVAASTENDQKCSFSNYGSKIDVSAPGGMSNILSTMSDNSNLAKALPSAKVSSGYYRLQGTSMACPHVSGVAALILAKNPNFTNEEARQALRISADDIGAVGFDYLYGFGRINALKAVNISSVCAAKIWNPAISSFQKGVVAINGTAKGASFSNYSLSYKLDSAGASWQAINVNSPYTAVNSGKLADWDTSQIPDGVYLLRLAVTDTAGRNYLDYTRINILNLGSLLGDAGAEIKSAIVVVDLDKDGQKEIIFTTANGRLYVMDKNGTSKPGWPIVIEAVNSSSLDLSVGAIGYSSPVVADINNDGNLEIVVHRYRFAYAFDKNGKILSGWPVELSKNLGESNDGFFRSITLSSPVVGDINNDGKLEVVAVQTHSLINVVKGDGVQLSGWPRIVNDIGDYLYLANPAIGDIDGDGNNEIVMQTYLYMNRLGSGKIHIFRNDGSYLSGWPKIVDPDGSSPVLGDLNGDGKLEVVFTTDDYSASYNNKKIHAVAYDGSNLPGWPVFFPSSYIADQANICLVDLNRDGKAEVIVSALEISDFNDTSWDKSVVVFDSTGNLLWKAEPIAEGEIFQNISSEVTVADINNDGNLEIIVPASKNDGHLIILDKDGRKIKDLFITDPILSTPTIDDLDGDGKLEIIVGTKKGKVLVFRGYGNAQPVNMPWPMFRHDMKRSGLYALAATSTANNPPVASNQTVSTNTNVAKTIVLSATDPDNDTLTYEVVVAPAHGVLIGLPSANVTYTPTSNYAGSDTFTYKAKDSKGAYSNVATVSINVMGSTVPAAPTNLWAQLNSATEVSLGWTDNSNNETGFKIERQINNSGPFTLIKTMAANILGYQDKGLTPNTTYTYRVYAYNAVGNSAYLEYIKTTPALPVNPTNLTATAVATNKIQLRWSGNANYLYSIERKIGVSGEYAFVTGVTALGFLDDRGLTADTTYYYRVQGMDNFGVDTAYSNEASATTQSLPTVPNAPNNLTAQAASPTQIQLNWSDSSNNETGFRIERSPGLLAMYAQIATVPANTVSYTDSGLTPNTLYEYRVCSYNAVGDSFYSAEYVIKTPEANNPPVAQNQVISTNMNTAKTFVLSVSDLDNDMLAYEIVTAPAHGTLTGPPSANVIYTPISNYVGSDSFTYKVKDSKDAYSNVATVSISVIGIAPAVPSVFTSIVQSSTEIALSWIDNSSNETGFKIERKTGNAGVYALIYTAPANTISFKDTGLTPSTKYCYRMKAYNLTGESVYTPPVSPTTYPAIPQAPTNLSAVGISVNYIRLNWKDNSSTEYAFTIERKIVGGTYAQVFQVGNNLITADDGPLTPNTTYYYRIKAWNLGGVSAYSNEASATTLPAQVVPAAPTNLTAQALSPYQVKLSWMDKSNNETSFRIERRTTGNYAEITYTSANTTSYTDAVNSNTAYYYRVCAANSTGKSVYSNECYLITPVNVNHPPVAQNLMVYVKKNTVQRVALTATESDLNDYIASYQIVSTAARGLVSRRSTFEYYYTPNNNYIGSDSFTYRAKDSKGVYSNTATVNIIVNLTGQPPTTSPIKVWKPSADRWGPSYCHENWRYNGPKICDAPRGQNLTNVDCSAFSPKPGQPDDVKTAYDIKHNFKCMVNQ